MSSDIEEGIIGRTPGGDAIYKCIHCDRPANEYMVSTDNIHPGPPDYAYCEIHRYLYPYDVLRIEEKRREEKRFEE